MGNEHDKREPIGGPMAPDAEGKTAGSNTQSQGGISHKVARSAREDFDPAAGLPGGLPRVDPPGMSLDQGGRGDKGSAGQGFSGDDGDHVPSDSTGVPASRNLGAAAGLGAQQDARVHGLPRDPADRTTGADTPNRGGTAGSPGGPARTASAHVPGQETDEGVIQGGQSGNDAQRDQQI
ncbi:hypothetical protein [Frateuria sp. STR12]|uniref:hypothetical protein n=1 Tax=Frateuria hangzhouensis TaxID=2995589 RepID=UPI002260FF64|nr:hypothetical protein [Frateuria sp. STR12]MCX7514634.1 hypothetical protein [Frateuria sp. STR12]